MNIDNPTITIPKIVCAYLKGPNIFNKNWLSMFGFSFRIISNPPLISVPKIKLEHDNDIINARLEKSPLIL